MISIFHLFPMFPHRRPGGRDNDPQQQPQRWCLYGVGRLLPCVSGAGPFARPRAPPSPEVNVGQILVKNLGAEPPVDSTQLTLTLFIHQYGSKNMVEFLTFFLPEQGVQPNRWLVTSQLLFSSAPTAPIDPHESAQAGWMPNTRDEFPLTVKCMASFCAPTGLKGGGFSPTRTRSLFGSRIQPLGLG